MGFGCGVFLEKRARWQVYVIRQLVNSSLTRGESDVYKKTECHPASSFFFSPEWMSPQKQAGAKPKRKRTKELTGLQRFRRQSLDRSKTLRKTIRANNKELKAVLRDLAKLKAKK